MNIKTASESELLAIKEKADNAKAILVNNLLLILSSLQKVQTHQAIDLEVKTVRIGMPKSFWDNFEAITDLFSLRSETEEPLINHDDVQDNILATFNKETDLEMSEILFSEFMLDSITDFTTNFARNEAANELREYMATGSPEKLAAAESILKILNPNFGKINDESTGFISGSQHELFGSSSEDPEAN